MSLKIHKQGQQSKQDFLNRKKKILNRLGIFKNPHMGTIEIPMSDISDSVLSDMLNLMSKYGWYITGIIDVEGDYIKDPSEVDSNKEYGYILMDSEDISKIQKLDKCAEFVQNMFDKAGFSDILEGDKVSAKKYYNSKLVGIIVDRIISKGMLCANWEDGWQPILGVTSNGYFIFKEGFEIGV